MDSPHDEVIPDDLLFDPAVRNQVFDDRNQETLIVFPVDIPEIGISTSSECLESKVSIKRIGENDNGDQGILGTDLSNDLNCSRITRIPVDNDGITPGQGFPKICRFRQQGYAQFPVCVTPSYDVLAV
jgi:hypothetical protein